MVFHFHLNKQIVTGKKRTAYKEVLVQAVVIKRQNSFGHNALIIVDPSCILKSVMLMNAASLI